MFCTNCGRELTNDARFCSQCGQGTRIEAAPGIGYYAPRRLYRLMYDKQIGGVCAGVAKYADLDVTLVRVLTLVVTVFTGVAPGVIAYLLAMMVMPKDQGSLRAAPMVTATPPAA
jgi:phage shock protein PspC (stress-responsive transcriptional regulator)